MITCSNAWMDGWIYIHLHICRPIYALFPSQEFIDRYKCLVYHVIPIFVPAIGSTQCSTTIITLYAICVSGYYLRG